MARKAANVMLDETGSVLVEFALAFVIFWTALISVVEFSRLMFLWGTASEATRIAARLASICEKSSLQEGKIRTRVASLLNASGQVSLGTRTDWLVLSYYPSGCTSETCLFVEAKLNDVRPTLTVPGLAAALKLPDFRILIPRESMRNAIKGESNNVCT